jgi:hypothetical protein
MQAKSDAIAPCAAPFRSIAKRALCAIALWAAPSKEHRRRREKSAIALIAATPAIAVLDKSVLHSSEKRYKHPDSSVESSILNERMREF